MVDMLVWSKLKIGELIAFLTLLLIPFSVILAYIHTSPLWVFITSAIAIIPLANWIQRATEQISLVAGSAIGGLLNVTFGNMPELILAIFVLIEGKTGVVKATITGSIVGNSLLGLGLAILVGSWGREKQTFKRERAGLRSSLLILSVIALILPALFDFTERNLHATDVGLLDEHLSLGVAIVLILAYAGNLVYTLITHRDIFAGSENEGHAKWSLPKSLAILVGATIVVAVEADLVSGALETTAGAVGISEFFLGVVVLPIIGNAAEYFAAVYFARKDQMDLVMSIAVGSTIQIALMTAPILVLVSYTIGHPMNLVFNSPLELIAIAGVAFAVNAIAQDGETTWFEGLLLIVVYTLLALSFFFVT
jgi:Ca2+:H+ antiporter